MPALVAGIHVLRHDKDVDGRNKSGHDALWFNLKSSRASRCRGPAFAPERFRVQPLVASTPPQPASGAAQK